MAKVKPTALAKKLNDAVATTHDVFPRKLENLLVFLMPESNPLPGPGAIVYASPEIAAGLAKKAAAVKKLLAETRRDMDENDWQGTAQHDIDFDGKPVNIIAMNKNLKGIFSRWCTRDMVALFYTDHEIGHLILKDGLGDGQIAENAADAYAMLRHIQRFGKNTGIARRETGNAARWLVLEADTDHYTADALERAAQIADEKDISGLSLRATARLAEKISRECALEERKLREIREAFAPVRRAAKKHEAGPASPAACEALCRETLAVMRKHRNDVYIFKAGKRFLNTPEIKKFMAEAAKTNDGWKSAHDMIDAEIPALRGKWS